ncbi:MAG: Proline--tRNA ligase [Chlamydiales bacterium]|nr:Proline--tRNA ligase [Chlamydiales bacterium]MCH9635547.1 Proline--tRNA ligase [Chlamydiales bacterium]
MRATQLFFRTFKEAPADADIASHKLLERAGYIHRLGRGLFTYSSLMLRVFEKLKRLVREEMEKAGAIEVELPHLHPAELWQESKRWEDYTAERLLYTVEDREGHPFCIAPTHEEAMTQLVRAWVKSYKELPINLYQIGAKFRDEIRPRFGLIRAKEFLMKDGYSFSPSEMVMNEQYEKMRTAYSAILDRLGLDYVLVQAHGGKIADGKSQEFQVKTEIGEDQVMLCGDFAANVEATVSIPPPYAYENTQKEQRLVETPGVTSIEELSRFLKIDPQLILKTVVFKLIFLDRKEFVAIGIRGDRQVNPLKVQDHFDAVEIEPATDSEISKLSVVGFIGPIDCPYTFLADESVRPMRNFCCANNKKDVHLVDVNFDKEPEYHDFLLAEEGDSHPEGGTLTIQRGTEVAHIFNIGTKKYAEPMEALFQDENGKRQPLWMGTYGLGIGRTAQACVEQRHDDRGIIWPMAIAPFKVAIIPAAMKNEQLVQTAEKIYEELLDFDPLLDDRDQRLGFKIKDSDLIGIPYKLIVGKSLEESGKVEIESRDGTKELVALDQISKWASSCL